MVQNGSPCLLEDSQRLYQHAREERERREWLASRTWPRERFCQRGVILSGGRLGPVRSTSLHFHHHQLTCHIYRVLLIVGIRSCGAAYIHIEYNDH